MTSDADAELAQEPLADRRRRDARRGLASRGALENVARVVAIVLEEAGEVGVAGAHARDRALARNAGVGVGRGVHDLLPVLPVAIADQHRDRRADRLAGADAGQEFDGVLLDLHAAPAAVALLAPRELAVDVRRKQRQARRHSFENAHEGRAMRFTGGRETEDHAVNLSALPSVHVAAPRAARSFLLTVQA